MCIVIVMKKIKRIIIIIDFYYDSFFFNFIDFGELGMQEVDFDLICYFNFIIKNREEVQLFCLFVFDFVIQVENFIF